MTEFIADSKFMALRAELQEQSMLLREILKALQSGSPLGAAAATSAKAEAKTPKAPAIPKEAVGKATVETVQEVDTGKTDDTAKANPWGKAEPVEMATRLPSQQEESNPQPPAVPRRGQTETGSRGR